MQGRNIYKVLDLHLDDCLSMFSLFDVCVDNEKNTLSKSAVVFVQLFKMLHFHLQNVRFNIRSTWVALVSHSPVYGYNTRLGNGHFPNGKKTAISCIIFISQYFHKSARWILLGPLTFQIKCFIQIKFQRNHRQDRTSIISITIAVLQLKFKGSFFLYTPKSCYVASLRWLCIWACVPEHDEQLREYTPRKNLYGH